MRLIDADELLTDNTWTWFDEWGNCTPAGEIIMNAPTIDEKHEDERTGRMTKLIDADALIKRLKEDWPQTSKISWAQIVAKCAPTIRAEDLPRTCPICGARTGKGTQNVAICRKMSRFVAKRRTGPWYSISG